MDGVLAASTKLSDAQTQRQVSCSVKLVCSAVRLICKTSSALHTGNVVKQLTLAQLLQLEGSC